MYSKFFLFLLLIALTSTAPITGKLFANTDRVSDSTVGIEEQERGVDTVAEDNADAATNTGLGSTALADAKPTDTNLRLNVDFCDSMTKFFTTNPGAPFRLCAEVSNPFPFPITAHFFINNGTKDANGVYLCDAFATSMSENFGGYDERITVPALDSVRIEPQAVFGVENIGELHGCLSHEINQENAVAEVGYAIRLRNSNTFTVLVTGTIDNSVVFGPALPGSSLGSSITFGVARDGGNLIIGTTAYNSGALVQAIQMSGVVTDWFGKSYSIAPVSGAVVPAQALVLTSTVTDTLPWYQFWFTADITMSYVAEYSQLDPSLVTDAISQTYTIQEQVTFFVIPWWLVIAAGIIILLALIFHRITVAHRQELAALHGEIQAHKEYDQE